MRACVGVGVSDVVVVVGVGVGFVGCKVGCAGVGRGVSMFARDLH